MSNQRSVMTEFRFLDQKRQAEGLTSEEASRYAQLRDLVGPETAGPPRSGFDVNAAAARLRESLLPAGLRNRPPEAAPPPPAPEPVPEPAPETLALEQAWAEAPFADLTPAPADPLFDPGSLAQEVRPQAWNPEAPGYDPDAPYDEAAWIAAGYDPNATYDWSAYGYGPDGQPLATDPAAPVEAVVEAAPAEAALEASLEPAEPAPLEALEPALEVLEPAPVADEPPLPGEPIAAAPADPDDGWDAAPVEAAPEDWVAPEGEHEPELTTEVELVAEPEQAEQGEPAAAAADDGLPFDPNAPFDHAKWFGRPAVAAAPAPAQEPAQAADPLEAGFDATQAPAPAEPEAALELEPELEPEAALELEPEPEPLPEPAPEAALAFGGYDEASAGAFALAAAPELRAEPPPAEPPPLDLDLGHAEPPPAAADASADWLGDGSDTPYQPAPEGAAFGEYDEAGAPLAAAPGLEAALPFDAGADAALEAGATPEGYEPGGPALDPATLPPVELGDYDDAPAFADQLYGGPEGEELPGGAPLELGDALPDWQPDAALEAGFELASDGSFGHAEAPAGRTPAWGTPAQAAPVEGWESAPALDLSSPFEPDATAEDLPTIDGAELLEELPPEAPAPALELEPALDLASPEPLALDDAGHSPLDGAFEDAQAIEAAAYPPPDLATSFTELPPEPLAAPAAEPFAEAEPLAEAPALEPAPEPFAAAAPYAEPLAEEPQFEALPEPAAFEPATAEPAAAEPAAYEPLAEDAAAWAAAAVEPPAEPASFEPPGELIPEHAHAEPEPAVTYEPDPEGLPPEIAAAYGAQAPDPFAPAPADPFEVHGSDTFELPPAVAAGLFEPAPAAEPLEAEPLPGPAPSVQVAGSHRVVLHTVDGQVRRGLLVDAYLDAPLLPLQGPGPGAEEELSTDAIKAIFFMLSPGEKAPPPEGKKVRVTFRDGRQVAGFSPDYQDGLVGFFMIPADTRTNTGRIWVYQAAVKAVSIS